MDQKHKRPIGESGPIRVAHSDGDPLVTWLKIRFPGDKASQEKRIALLFVHELNALDKTKWILEELPERDFDFLMRAADETRYLELQETIIPPAKRGSPYSSREQVIHSGKFSDTIASGIRKKAAKYPKGLEKPLDLLIYATHWRFLPNQKVLQLVAHRLQQTAHPFERVYHLALLDQERAQVEKLLPNDQLLRDFDWDRARTTRYVNFDPGAREPVKKADGSIGVRFTLGPDALKKLRGS